LFSKNKIFFHGRRKGRKISPTKLKLLEDYRNSFYLREDKICKLKLYKFKKNILEIGFGNGQNLVNMSLNQPNDLFIGCDVYFNGCAKLLDQIVSKNIKNIKIWPDDINLIIKNFKKNFFDLILILQPDPWPKKKHKKRRLIQQKFLDDLHQILKCDGELIISTDHDVMKSWVLEQIHIRDDFLWVRNGYLYKNKQPRWIINTKYINKAVENNKVVNWFFFKKN
jgi:tRNA (guanine-N7-)-methyltransferase